MQGNAEVTINRPELEDTVARSAHMQICVSTEISAQQKHQDLATAREPLAAKNQRLSPGLSGIQHMNRFDALCEVSDEDQILRRPPQDAVNQYEERCEGNRHQHTEEEKDRGSPISKNLEENGSGNRAQEGLSQG